MKIVLEKYERIRCFCNSFYELQIGKIQCFYSMFKIPNNKKSKPVILDLASNQDSLICDAESVYLDLA